ncbi:hypothetical protein PIB30_052558 [Stylosanthes scabra]|uniref:Uncharacterized protein n=1 Tax=Stylosanthes scabra TaxID=79078 RepID=A0ABU6WIP5_9FABA|nr:hypothetical protein [Stylosanthes scabra]
MRMTVLVSGAMFDWQSALRRIGMRCRLTVWLVVCGDDWIAPEAAVELAQDTTRLLVFPCDPLYKLG